MKHDTTEELVLSPSYIITFKELSITNLTLSSEEKVKFVNYSAKTKVSQLDYFKRRAAVESNIVDVVEQSKYLRLLKDPSGLHLRVVDDLDSEDFNLECKIEGALRCLYSPFLSEDFNSGMSGDMNRKLIASGTLS